MEPQQPTWHDLIERGFIRDLGALVGLVIIALAHVHGVPIHWLAPLR